MAMRIGGLASGMDIDTLVSDLMKAERMPLDKLNQKKQILEWQRDDYRSMNSLLKEFDDFIFNNVSLQKDMLKKSVTSSNPSAVTATAVSTAVNTSTVINVTQLATSQTWASGAVGTYNHPFASDTTIQLKVTNGDGTSATLNNDGTTTTIPINIKGGSTLEEVLATLSNTKELGITAFYDKQKDKVVITKNDTGSKAKIDLADSNARDLFTALGFTYTTETDANGVVTGYSLDIGGGSAGKNADFTINGYQTERASNDFTINNVNYKLHGNGSSSITVANDTESMFDKIVQFVNKYNETIEKINQKLSEERYRDYKPLSKEEEESMSEKQVERWEERAKSGLIRNDSILSGALSKMRMDFYAPVSGTGINSDYSQLAQLGIKTSSNYLDKGKLIIENETKLKEAIEKDPNAIFELFNASGSTTETTGIAKRLRDTISNTIESIEKKAGKATLNSSQYTIGRNLTQLGTQINRFEDRLIKVEDRYWRQFTAMEKAIQKSNQQSMYLMQQFGM